MVIKQILRIFLFSFLFLTAYAEADPVVDASIDSMNAQAHYPLDGILTITHKMEEKIDPSSFIMEGKPLEVSFEREVLMSASSDTRVAIYHFQLPGQDQGLYVLPEITVKIGNQIYHSSPASYEVKGGAPQAAPSSELPAAAAPLIFRLDAAVKGPTQLFPGERTKLYYRISYNRSIDLTQSDLPMIHPAHFQKVGDVQIHDDQKGNVTVQELTQEVEASSVGTFQFGPSVIEGYAYAIKGIQKVYDKTLLRATAPAITIEVRPFPVQNQPASFTGAIGTIQGEASLKSSSTVFVGDTVQLEVKVTGIEDLAELRLPVLQCQPGFSGFFQTSDLPPLSEVKEGAKFYHVEIRPMTSLIDQIPAIELSSFNAASGLYVIQKTVPISLTVNAHPAEKEVSLSAPLAALLSPPEKWPEPSISPLEFEAKPIERALAQGHHLGMRGIFWLVVLAAAILMLQRHLHRLMMQRPQVRRLKSEELWRQALKLDFSKRIVALSLLEQAFWHRLWEKGVLPPGESHFDKLPQNGPFKRVSVFLLQLQALQYSLNKEFNPSQLKETAKELFHLI